MIQFGLSYPPSTGADQAVDAAKALLVANGYTPGAAEVVDGPFDADGRLELVVLIEIKKGGLWAKLKKAGEVSFRGGGVELSAEMP